MSVDVAIGQVWADKDKRCPGRRVKVVGFTEKRDPWNGLHKAAVVVDDLGHHRSIRMERLVKAFTLIGEAVGQ